MAAQLSTVEARVWFFYLKACTGARGRLSVNIVREVCFYFEDPLLHQVSPAFLRSFNCQTSAWGPEVPLRTRIQVDESSIWVVLKDDCLFCSGGGNC